MTNDTTKRCTKCGEEKTLQEFSPHKEGKLGVSPHCKVCRRAYHHVNHEETLRKKREHREAHKEEINKKKNEHYHANKDKILPKQREYHQRNIARRRQARRAHYMENRAKINQITRQYYWEHRTQIRSQVRAQQPLRSVAARAYRANNRDKMRIQSHNRRTRLAGNGGRFTDKELAHIQHIQNGQCCYCGRIGLPLEIDHVIPVTQGGPSDIWNLALCCKSCNCSKGDRTIEEWLKAGTWYETLV